METARAVCIFIDHRKMVEDIAELRRCSHLPSTVGHTLDRWFVFHRPRHFIERMNRLLDNVIPREPGIIIPVLDLILDVGPITLPFIRRPYRAGVVSVV